MGPLSVKTFTPMFLSCKEPQANVGGTNGDEQDLDLVTRSIESCIYLNKAVGLKEKSGMNGAKNHIRYHRAHQRGGMTKITQPENRRAVR